jgi:hypothetical protein
MIYATLGLCALGAAVLVYRCELYDREPLPLVGVAIVLGAGAMAVAGRLEAFTFERFGLERRLALAGVAALEEEALKLLAVAALALHFGWDALAVRSEDPGAGGTRDGLFGRRPDAGRLPAVRPPRRVGFLVVAEGVLAGARAPARVLALRGRVGAWARVTLVGAGHRRAGTRELPRASATHDAGVTFPSERDRP